MAAKTLPGGTFTMAEDLTVTRMGYGAMQLAGPHVFGPPADRDAALAVLREALELARLRQHLSTEMLDFGTQPANGITVLGNEEELRSAVLNLRQFFQAGRAQPV